MAEQTTAPTGSTPQAQAAPQPQQGPERRGGGRGQGGPRGRRPEMPQEEKQFDERVVHIDRVARVVKGGRRFRFRALVVVGDRKHRVGVGTAKGADVTAAVTKATEVAKKHFITVPIHNGTIPHESSAKVSGAHILIKPASPGTGLIAGGTVRVVLEVAGISNALSKSLGSSNKTNAAYATIAALQLIVPAKEWVTRTHDKKAAKTDKTEASEKPAAKKPAAKKAEA
ncbi:MAG TPA: 30S ribosomal protein S5 [Candidatus Saccharimonadales bacterium]|nr:30S ribosomal protein S5 [Candidatus Saccharimonadales bacterium]